MAWSKLLQEGSCVGWERERGYWKINDADFKGKGKKDGTSSNNLKRRASSRQPYGKGKGLLTSTTM